MHLLKEDKVVEKAVGLRPGRPSTRIEREERDYQGNKKWASSFGKVYVHITGWVVSLVCGIL